MFAIIHTFKMSLRVAALNKLKQAQVCYIDQKFLVACTEIRIQPCPYRPHAVVFRFSISCKGLYAKYPPVPERTHYQTVAHKAFKLFAPLRFPQLLYEVAAYFCLRIAFTQPEPVFFVVYFISHRALMLSIPPIQN